MKEDFVTYGIAVKLGKKGFNIDTDFCYNQDGGIVRVGTCPAPQIHEVLKWLREEKKIYVAIDFFRFNGNTEIWWTYSVRYIDDDSTENIFESCKRKSWEQAALAGIEYVINNLI